MKGKQIVVLGMALAMLFEGAALYFALTEFSRTKGKWSYLEAVQKGKDPTGFVVLCATRISRLRLSMRLCATGCPTTCCGLPTAIHAA